LRGAGTSREQGAGEGEGRSTQFHLSLVGQLSRETRTTVLLSGIRYGRTPTIQETEIISTSTLEHQHHLTMLRYQLFLAIGASFLSVWYSAIQFSVDPLVLYAPVWGILLLGVYAVSNIAIGLVNFKDTPEAAAEIEQQVKEAKAEMTKRGVIKKE
jgi:hypothetical protein